MGMLVAFILLYCSEPTEECKSAYTYVILTEERPVSP
jgi:hypothetical protein